MARTKADLATAALRKLRVISAQETPRAADSEIVENAYADRLEVWREDGLVYWPNTTRTTAEIPAVVFDALANILAEQMAGEFGKEIPTLTDPHNGRQMSCGTKGMRELKRHLAKGPSGEPARATYY